MKPFMFRLMLFHFAASILGVLAAHDFSTSAANSVRPTTSTSTRLNKDQEDGPFTLDGRTWESIKSFIETGARCATEEVGADNISLQMAAL